MSGTDWKDEHFTTASGKWRISVYNKGRMRASVVWAPLLGPCDPQPFVWSVVMVDMDGSSWSVFESGSGNASSEDEAKAKAEAAIPLVQQRFEKPETHAL